MRARGLTQAQVAEILGVSDAAVSRWCTGDNAPDLATLARLSGITRTPTDDLLGLPGPDGIAAKQLRAIKVELRSVQARLGVIIAASESARAAVGEVLDSQHDDGAPTPGDSAKRKR